MSHFSLAVITRKAPTDSMLFELLEPYNENVEVDEYITQTREELLKEYRDKLENEKKNANKSPAIRKTNRFMQGLFLKEYLSSDEELIEILRENYSMDVDGNVLSTYNPDAHWDWWEIGGRWNNLIITKDGQHTNCAQIKDIAWEEMREDEEEVGKRWDRLIKNTDTLFLREPRYGSREHFIEVESNFRTYALIMPDGSWYEEGEMGWFGIVNSNVQTLDDYVRLFNKVIHDKEYEECYFTVIDCHI